MNLTTHKHGEHNYPGLLGDPRCSVCRTQTDDPTDDLLSTVIAVEAAETLIDSSTPDPTPDIPSSDFGGFDGGDTGGGGAGGDF